MYSSLTLMRQGIILKISVLKRVHGIVVWGWIYLVYGIFLKRQRQHSREFWVLALRYRDHQVATHSQHYVKLFLFFPGSIYQLHL